MRTTLRAALTALSLAMLTTVNAHAQIDNLADGTNIDNVYANSVFDVATLSCFGAACPTPNVYARDFGGFAIPGPDGYSTAPTGLPSMVDNLTGAIEVSLAQVESSASVEDYLFTGGHPVDSFGYLQAYDSGSHLLGEADATSNNVFSLLSLSFPNQISFLLLGDFQGLGDPSYSLFSFLCFSDDFNTPNCPTNSFPDSHLGASGGALVLPAATPEPGMLPPLVLCLAALAGGSLWKKRSTC